MGTSIIQEAYLFGKVGKAVFIQDGGYFILSLKNKDIIPCRVGDIGLLVDVSAEFSTMQNLESVDELREKLENITQAYKALGFALNGFDAELEEIRPLVIKRADVLCENNQVFKFVRNRLLGYPPSDEADISGAIQLASEVNALKIKELYVKVEKYRAILNLIHSVWRENATQYIDSEEKRKKMLMIFVDKGVMANFTQAVETGDYHQLDNFILDHVNNQEISKDFLLLFYILKDTLGNVLEQSMFAQFNANLEKKIQYFFDLMIDLSKLAILYKKQVKYAEAEPLFQMALEIYEKIFATEHSSVNPSVVIDLYKEAVECYEKMIDLTLQSKTADSVSQSQQRLEKYLSSLQITRIKLSTLCGDLGVSYKNLSRYREAESLLQMALAIDEKVFGQEHLNVAIDLNNLGDLYSMLDRFEEAKPLFEKALSILGEMNPKSAFVFNNLGELYRKQNNFKQAILLYKKALKVSVKTVGDKEHPDIATWLNNLANSYLELGKFKQTETLFKKILKIRAKRLGIENPLTAQSFNNLGDLHRRQGNYKKSEHLFKKALDIWKKAYGEIHLDIGNAFNNLGNLYSEQNKYEQAIPCLQRALIIYSKIYGKYPHSDVVQAYNNLGAAYLRHGKYRKAKPLFQRALAIYEEVYNGMPHPNKAAPLSNLALLFLHSPEKHYEQIESLFKESSAILKEVYQEKEHENMAINFNNLGGLYYEQGKYDQAESSLENALTIFKNVLNEGHPKIAMVQNNYNLCKLVHLTSEIKSDFEYLPTSIAA